MSDRINKDLYYLQIAKTVSMRSTCLRRHYGAIIVKNDEVIATGYNGAPRGEKNCIDIGHCYRESLGIAKGERYELCRSVHAEQNAIISAARRDMVGATIYIVGLEANGEEANPAPCIMCRRQILNAGIKRVVGLVNGEPKDLDISQEPVIKISEGKHEKTIHRIEGALALLQPDDIKDVELFMFLSRVKKSFVDGGEHRELQLNRSYPEICRTGQIWDACRKLGIDCSGGNSQSTGKWSYVFYPESN